jgi:hypothetical protein
MRDQIDDSKKRLPGNERAKAKRSEKNRTCRISPAANAPMTVVGMMCVT